MAVKIDCLGDMCPIPIMKAQKELTSIRSGDSLMIVTDHSCVARSLVEQLGKKKYRVEENEVLNGVWEITVHKH